MAFSGDFTPMFYKHTRKLDLKDSVSIAIDRIHRGFEPLKVQVEAMRKLKLEDEAVKLIIYQAFLDRSIRGVPRHLMPIVHDYYFKPEHEAFVPRNLWSLSNAFTSAFKKPAPVKQFEVTARLGSYLSVVQENLKEKHDLPFVPRKDNQSDDFGYEDFDADGGFDNIFVERLWRTVKQEEVYLQEYQDVWESEESLRSYFEFYNYQRRINH